MQEKSLHTGLIQRTWNIEELVLSETAEEIPDILEANRVKLFLLRDGQLHLFYSFNSSISTLAYYEENQVDLDVTVCCSFL